MNKIAHKSDCKMAFGRKDKGCPRCQELLKGAKPISWNFKTSVTVKAIRSHVCNTNCGVICTVGEW